VVGGVAQFPELAAHGNQERSDNCIGTTPAVPAVAALKPPLSPP
jgi:hypothetical protein